MKLLFIFIACLFAKFSAAQSDTISLCNLSVLSSYKVKNELGLPIDWSISPEVSFTQIGNSIQVNWTGLGTYIITAQYSTEYCSGPRGYKVVDVVECKETVIWVPNSFTPNYDDRNATFGPVGLNIYDYSMEIYNRWGELVFVTTDLNNQWAGSNLEANSIIDVYTYRIRYKDVKSRHQEIYGRVTLIK
jgi:gliding motility-associated-like protein